MNFEIIDNLFQVPVLFSAMAASAVTACKRKSRDFAEIVFAFNDDMAYGAYLAYLR